MVLGFVFLGVLLLLILLGVPVAFSLAGTTLLGLFYMGGWGGVAAMSNTAWSTTSEFVLTAIPLFAFAGFMLAESGAARRLVRISQALLWWHLSQPAKLQRFVEFTSL